jgi:hypothetical protein
MPYIPTVIYLSDLWSEVSFGTLRIKHPLILGFTVRKINQLDNVLRVNNDILKFDIQVSYSLDLVQEVNRMQNLQKDRMT